MCRFPPRYRNYSMSTSGAGTGVCLNSYSRAVRERVYLRQSHEGYKGCVQSEHGIVQLHFVGLPLMPLVVRALHRLGPVQRACAHETVGPLDLSDDKIGQTTVRWPWKLIFLA